MDINSLSSDSTDDADHLGSPPASGPALLLSLPRPASRRHGGSKGSAHATALPFGLRLGASLPGHVTISTPPSSPEGELMELEAEEMNMLKAGDWIKQVR